MNPIVSYFIEVLITLVLCLGLLAYLRPVLKRILVDLCATEERAQFWTVFSNILLVGLPMMIALTYRPEARNAEELFFEISRKVGGNFGGFLFALVGAGLLIALQFLFRRRGDVLLRPLSGWTLHYPGLTAALLFLVLFEAASTLENARHGAGVVKDAVFRIAGA